MFVLNKRYHHQMFRGLSDLIREFFMCFGAVDSSHIARTEICIVRDHRLITASLRLSFCILILIVGSLHIDTWLVATQRFFIFTSTLGKISIFTYIFQMGWVNHQLDTYFFHLWLFVGFPRLVHVEFWYAWYRNRRWKTLLNRLPWEKLTASWRLQECDNLKYYGGLL